MAQSLQQRGVLLRKKWSFLGERQPGAPGKLIQGARQLGRPVEHAEMACGRSGVVRAERIANAVGHERGAAIELGALARINLAAGEQLEKQGELAVREIEVEPAE